MPRRRTPQARLPRPLSLEILEDRTLLSASALDLSGLHVNTSAYSQTDILVRFQTTSGTTPAAVAGTTLGTRLSTKGDLYQVQLSPGVSVRQAVAAYRADSHVLLAEPDYLLSASSVANDPQAGQQWDFNNTGQTGGTPGADIHAQQAWNVTTGSPGVVVSVMDTGIDYDHPDLYLNVWINQAEIPTSRMKNLVDVDHDGRISFRDLNNPINQGVGKITDVNGDGRIDAADILAPMVLDSQGHDTGRGGWSYAGNTQDGDTAHPNDFIGWNFVNNTNNPFDDVGHGTHVSGTIGAVGNNGVGVAGVDWNVQLMPVKFLNNTGNGSIGNFIVGLNYAVAHGAQISNNSWTGSGNDPFLQQAISNARGHGHIFVAATGNNGVNNDTAPEYPASFPLDNVVSVAATDSNDQLARFSNYGANSISIAAPGVGILSTTPGNGYATLSGTSMATPHVTGALALVWGQHPGWTYSQVINQVLSTADRLPSLSGKVESGRLDLAAAVGATAAPTPARTPHVVSATVSGPSPNTANDVRLTFDEAIDPASLTAASVSLTNPFGQSVVGLTIQPVSGSNNTQFDVQFATQQTGGTYTLGLGTAVRDTTGNPLAQPYQTTFTLRSQRVYDSTTSVAIPAGAGQFAVALMPVSEDVAIGSIIVKIDIVYPRDGDLRIHLQAPDGTDILLTNRRGGTGSNFYYIAFEDRGAPLTSGQAPFASSYRPEVALSNLTGKSTKGYWKLWIENQGGTAAGRLDEWTLLVTPQASAAITPAAATAGPRTAQAASSPGALHASTVLVSAGTWVQATSATTTGVDGPLEPTPGPRASTTADGVFGSRANMARLRRSLSIPFSAGDEPISGSA